MPQTAINTGLQFTIVGYPPNRTDDWRLHNQTYGRVRWFNVHLLRGRPEEKRVELERIYWQRPPPPNDQDLSVDIVIRNLGPGSATFVVLFAETVSLAV